ncbi:hypothetical protein [Streptomyces sp. Je 1-79]|uniref:hypothetical protein n=1 Tax=Streptomyces sp. Je 1-79 TaxID=2943847 RepID=UPI0027E53578|nr:hypothetical protein [Streptomyces sp. Je 1-79]
MPTAETPPATAGTSGGLNLSALRTEQPPAVESEADALARQFREQIDAQFATTPERDRVGGEQPPAADGLNLCALRDEDNAARTAALALFLASGPDGTGASAIARALADAHGTSRQTVVVWLKTWTDDGTAVRIGTGTKARYVHHRSGRPAVGCERRCVRANTCRAVLCTAALGFSAWAPVESC